LLPSAAMTFDDHDSRGPRSTAGGAAAVALLGAIAVGTVLYTNGDGGGERTAPPPVSPFPSPFPSASTAAKSAPSGAASLPAGAPDALPSPLARPAVRPEQAFPEKNVRLKDGSRYQRVGLATTTDCAEGLSAESAALVDRGEGCARLTSALFTDVERRSRTTVTVASFRRAEDASAVFARVSTDPVAHRVVPLVPQTEAGLPAVPPGSGGPAGPRGSTESAGLFAQLMTVRSVVFAHGQGADGAEPEEVALARRTQGLLRYVHDHVMAYEQGGHG
ncbi:hypothetical protein, partial [Streptomyces viridosporus]|uniref:hypothetical protein n=1 Tax=Streptomyces viridosporus TaxID=67581 RepID=UPI0034CFE450